MSRGTDKGGFLEETKRIDFIGFSLYQMQPTEAKSIIEALLFVSSESITIRQITQVLENIDSATARRLIYELRDEYNGSNRSFQIIEIANGFQMCTRPEYSDWIKKFYTRQVATKLSKAALETLAIVAYKQPVTRAGVEEIRGVNSDGVLNGLMEKGLIRISGRKSSPGRPLLFITTDDFLKQFGLKNLSELPTEDEIGQILVPDAQ